MSPDPPSRSSRFSVIRELGSGGFGVVYLVHDRERDERVALKVLRKADGDSLLRFKNEFRALAEISHPNLIALHELIFDEGRWFFTMEHIDGVDLLTWITHGLRRDAAGVPRVPTQSLQAGEAPDTPGDDRPFSLNVERLRAVLPQLVAGVAALHTAGKLHCDIKPANVLVDAGGRVVLLDFGLVTELGSDGSGSSDYGTPLYAAPEQGGGEALTPAADWYSVGVLLYRAMAGSHPHRGSKSEVLRKKRSIDPTSPDQVRAEVPADLAALAMELLARNPAQRPDDTALVQRFGLANEAPALPRLPSLVGRRHELARLARAYGKTREGRAVIVHVHGPSGVGKTTLVDRFAGSLAPDASTVVLRGRCYEQESVPYNAVDSLIDALSGYLGGLPRSDLAAVLPADAHVLAQLFPVLGEVAGRVSRPAVPGLAAEPLETRRRAFQALRDVLAKVAERASLVLALDDLQWGDEDSALLLSALLQPPAPPAMLLLASYRRGGIESSSLVNSLRGLETGDEVESMELALGDLLPEAAADLATSLTGREPDDPLVQTLARESGGNPFLLQALAGFGVDAEAPPDSDPPSVERMLRARLEALSASARTCLELTAVAGMPVRERVLRGVGDDDDGLSLTLRTLRTARLVRTFAAEDRDLVEPYHDQIRKGVIATLSPGTLRAHHLRLAAALEADGGVDPEALAVHLEGAGETARAGACAREAAERAASALAFDRAAQLYQRALNLAPAGDVSLREVRAGLAEALANAGRGTEAAPIYLDAAEGAEESIRLDRKRRAAEEWMKNGHIERGLEVLRQVLAAGGMKLARTPRRAVLSLLLRRAQLRLQGGKTRLRSAEDVDPGLLRHIDLCWAVWVCLGMADFIRATEFHTRNLLASLDAGEPYRLARALAMEASFLPASGASHRRVAAALGRAQELASRIDHPHANGLVLLAEGLCAYLEGRFQDVHAPCERAAGLLRGWPGASWELANARHYELEGLVFTGRLPEARELLPGYIQDVHDRGDLFGSLSLRLLAHTLHLADDEPERALREVEEAMAGYTRTGVHISHYWEFYARGQIRLYAGEGRAGLQEVDRIIPGLRRNQMLRVSVARAGAYYLRARLCLRAASGSTPAPDDLIRRAVADAGRIERSGTFYGRALASQIRAAACHLRGERQPARTHLDEALAGFEALGMATWAAASRRAIGILVGGAEGDQRVRAADEVLSKQGIRSPARMAAMLVPGFS